MTDKRPQLFDEDVVRETVETLMSKVVAWFAPGAEKLDASELDEVRSDLNYAIKLDDNVDNIVQRLFDRDWEVDHDLIALLKEVKQKRYVVHRKTVKDWVKKNNLVPRHRIGDTVKLDGTHGTVVSIEHETAQYVVFSEKLGHVRSGLGIRGTFVNYEDVK